jgi:hypothetical protein
MSRIVQRYSRDLLSLLLVFLNTEPPIRSMSTGTVRQPQPYRINRTQKEERQKPQAFANKV